MKKHYYLGRQESIYSKVLTNLLSNRSNVSKPDQFQESKHKPQRYNDLKINNLTYSKNEEDGDECLRK